METSTLWLICIFSIVFLVHTSIQAVTTSENDSSQEKDAGTPTGQSTVNFLIKEDNTYQITRYLFSHSGCRTRPKQNVYLYEECDKAHIIENESFSVDFDHLAEIHLGVICFTDKLPVVSDQGTLSFTCDQESFESDTQVRPKVICVENGCYLTPGSVSHSLDYLPKENDLTIHTLKQETKEQRFILNHFQIKKGRPSSCLERHVCYWLKKSHFLITKEVFVYANDERFDSSETNDTNLGSLFYYLQSKSLYTLTKHALPFIPIRIVEITKTDLKFLPEDVCELTDIEQLALPYNKITHFPNCMGKLTKLKILDASFNELSLISNITFGSEQEKTYVDLSHNHISKIVRSAFSRMQNLVFLFVHNNFLNDVNFFLPNSLKYLNLTHNRIKNINPLAFTNLTTLTHLDIGFNKIEMMDKTLFHNCRNLLHLRLSNNQLKSFDMQIPLSLEHLDLSYNQISFINVKMFLFVDNNFLNDVNFFLPNSLEYLNLTYNTIINIHSQAFTNLTTLTHLDMAFNKIEMIDKTLFHNCTNLLHLRLSNNQLKSFDMQIPSSLEHLDLSFNQISFINVKILNDVNFFLPNSLKYLNLTHNRIKNIHPQALTNLTTLTHIDMAFNNIEIIDKTLFHNCTNLLHLRLSNNQLITFDMQIPSSLEHLDLSFNQISSINVKTFNNAMGLKRLYLSNNSLKSFDLLINLNKVTHVSLKANMIEHVPNNFCSHTCYKNLEFLDLSYNNIKILNLDVFINANKLQVLLLDHNSIQEIIGHDLFWTKEREDMDLDDNLNNGIKRSNTHDITYDDHKTNGNNTFSNLEVLNISYNSLYIAPLSLIFIPNIKCIDFSHNSIKLCSWWNMSEETIKKKIDKYLDRSAYKVLTEGMPQSHVVDLQYNKLETFPTIFHERSVLMHRDATLFAHVRIWNNPIQCDCHAFPYIKAIQTFYQIALINFASLKENYRYYEDGQKPHNQLKNIFPGNYICHSPPELILHNLFDEDLLEQSTCLLSSNNHCKLSTKPYRQTIVIDCSNQQLQSIPFSSFFIEEIKTFSKEKTLLVDTPVTILLNGNNLQYIDYKDGLKHLLTLNLLMPITSIDMSNSNIAIIDSTFFIALSISFHHLKTLKLANNNLKSIDLYKLILYYKDDAMNKDKTIPFWDRLEELHLYNNPWDCSYEAFWMKEWLNKLIARKILVQPHQVQCQTPMWVQGRALHTHTLHYFYFNLGINIIFCVLFTFTCLSIKCMIYPKQCRQYGHHPSFQSIEIDKDTPGILFDAFISYCEDDSNWVENDLIPKLEGLPPYKTQYQVCHHKRHFKPWITSDENEINAIKQSRRTIIVLSNSYLTRRHCVSEFIHAYEYWIKLKRNPNLVVLKYPDVDCKNLGGELQAYFNKFPYLEKNEYMWERLFELMPKDCIIPTVENGTVENTSAPVTGEIQILFDEAEEVDQHSQKQTETSQLEEEIEKMIQEAEDEAEQEEDDVDPGEIYLRKVNNNDTISRLSRSGPKHT